MWLPVNSFLLVTDMVVLVAPVLTYAHVCDQYYIKSVLRGNNKNAIQTLHTRKSIVLFSIVCIEIVDKGEVVRTSSDCE